jgi:SAM-dependent methyltransferase
MANTESIRRKRLNIGCGMKKLSGWINVDYNPRFNPDVVWDIMKKGPFRDNDVDYIYCDNVLEHLSDFVPAMRQFYRILKPGGKLKIISPHFSSVFWDIPSHKRPFAYYTFYHFYRGYKVNRETEDLGAYFSRIRVRLVFAKRFAIWNWLVEPCANAYPLIYEQTFLRGLFPCWLVEVTLTK